MSFTVALGVLNKIDFKVAHPNISCRRLSRIVRVTEDFFKIKQNYSNMFVNVQSSHCLILLKNLAVK